MDNNTLKTGLFGYTKISVCEYIAQVNQEFSDKLLEVTENYRTERNELKQKIEELETELEKYKGLRGEISTAILDAKEYGSQLRRQAEKEAEQMRADNSREKRRLDGQIEEYRDDIEKMVRQIRQFMQTTEQALDAYEEKMEAIKKSHKTEEGETAHEALEETDGAID